MEYRQLENFNAYEIYADGRIIRRKWKTPNGTHLKRQEVSQTIASNGYQTVKLMNNQGEHKQFYVHRLIWTAWVGEIANGDEIDHKNGLRNGKDENGIDANDLSNLRLTTHKENCNNPKSLENYRRANALSACKFHRDKMIAAQGKERYEQLKRLYLMLFKERGKVGIYMLMKVGHCGYPRACKVVKEMKSRKCDNFVENIS